MNSSVTAPCVYTVASITSSTSGNGADMAEPGNLWLCVLLYTSVLFCDAIQWVVVAVVGYGVDVL